MTYPLKKKADIIEFLMEHHSYVPLNINNGGRVLAWNVKHWPDLCKFSDDTRKEFQLDAALDDAWAAHVEKSESVYYWILEDMRRYWQEDFTDRRGAEAKFFFNGRSAGHMCLDSVDFLHVGAWRMCSMAWEDRHHMRDWLGELSFPKLLKLYKLVCDVDAATTKAAIAAEYEHQAAFQRQQWEEEHKTEKATKWPHKVPENFTAGAFI